MSTEEPKRDFFDRARDAVHGVAGAVKGVAETAIETASDRFGGPDTFDEALDLLIKKFRAQGTLDAEIMLALRGKARGLRGVEDIT